MMIVYVVYEVDDYGDLWQIDAFTARYRAIECARAYVKEDEIDDFNDEILRLDRGINAEVSNVRIEVMRVNIG